MRGEVPQFKRCCFCIPLRRGLIGWGYAKLCLNIWMILYFVQLSVFVIAIAHYLTVIEIAFIIFMGVSLLADVSFNVLLIVAGHQKSIKLLKITYIYNLVWLGCVLAISAYEIYLCLVFTYKKLWAYRYGWYTVSDLVLGSTTAFTSVFVQVYLILLIRSELKKLQNETLEMQYTNHLASGEAGEPQCTLHRASTSDTDQCTGENARAVEV